MATAPDPRPLAPRAGVLATLAMALPASAGAVESEPIPGVFLLPDGQVQIIGTLGANSTLAITPSAAGGVQIVLNGHIAVLSAAQAGDIDYQGGGGGSDAVTTQVPLGTVVLASGGNSFQGGCGQLTLFGGGNTVDTLGFPCVIQEFGGGDTVNGANASITVEDGYTLSAIPGVVINQGELTITPTLGAGNQVEISEDDGQDIVVSENGLSESFDTTVLDINGIAYTASAGGGDSVENDSLVGMLAYAYSSSNTLVDTSDAGVSFYLLGDDETAWFADSGGAIYVDGLDEVLNGTYAADIAIVENGGTYTLIGDGTSTTTTTTGSSTTGTSTGGDGGATAPGMAGGQISGGGCGLSSGAALLLMGAISLGRARRRLP
jgi:hypothetical protein